MDKQSIVNLNEIHLLKKKTSQSMQRAMNAVQISPQSSIDMELNDLFHRYRDIKCDRLDRERSSIEFAKRLNVLHREESKPDFQQLKQIEQTAKKDKHSSSLQKIKKMLETAYEEKENLAHKKKLITSSIKERRDEVLQSWKEIILKRNQSNSVKLREDGELRYSFILMQKNKEEKKKKAQRELIQEMREQSSKKLLEFKLRKKYNQKQELLKKISEETALKEKYDQYVLMCEEKKKSFSLNKGVKFPHMNN